MLRYERDGCLLVMSMEIQQRSNGTLLRELMPSC